MSTPKEIFLELIRPDGQPERQLRQYEALHMCLTDPCNTYLRGNRKRGTTSVDRWGTTILFPEDAPGPMPDTREGLAVCPDVTRWRETVHAPDLEAACTEGWGHLPRRGARRLRVGSPAGRVHGHGHFRAVPLPHGL
ncbi:MAG: hypothetical protein ACLSHG_11855 [Oscillospiraceae bacterium]